MGNKINWFPGHMNSSIKNLAVQIKQCDVVLYVLDARCPRSCLNPSFSEFTSKKPVIFVLNKADLAPKPNFAGISLDSTKSNTSNKVTAAIKRLLPNKTRVHAMVIGVPNCGKSTLINNIVHKAKTKTADKPGVTRVPQWVASDGNLFLLDTPGILWPNLEDQRVARNLACIGAIKDDILDIIELAEALIFVMQAQSKCVGIPKTLQGFAQKRGHILAGGKFDLLRSARVLLNEFRAGKFGKFDLDAAPDLPSTADEGG